MAVRAQFENSNEYVVSFFLLSPPRRMKLLINPAPAFA